MKNKLLFNAKTWSLVPLGLTLLILMLFSTMASAEVEVHTKQQDDSVNLEIENVGNETAYILNSLTILDQTGNIVYVSQDPVSAELISISPGINYTLEWDTNGVLEGNYTSKIYHGDNKRNLKAISSDFFRGKRNQKPIFYTDKKFYKYGEEVVITFMNMGTNTIYVNINNWEIKNLDTGIVVSCVGKDNIFGYGPCGGYSFEPLRFLKTIDNFWNQENIKGNQVVPGKYDVTAQYSRNDPASGKIIIETISTKKFYIRSAPAVRGDLNGNGVSADAGDLDMMKKASIGEITPDSGFDLNNNGMLADAGDLVLMKRASRGEIDLQETNPGKG